MKISLKWLKNYIDINLKEDELIEKLRYIGIDIDNIEKQAEKLNNFVIGKVLEKKKHPNADKLTVCNVDIGDEILHIVCGAPNVDKGQFVCVAKIGAILPNGGIEIKKHRIRGVDSEGMICSEKEMNLGEDREGIMVLADKLKPGSQFADYINYNDVIFDFEITPNRGDLLSYFGIAREIGFIVNKRLRKPNLHLDRFYSKDKDRITDYIEVCIENPDLCYRYFGMLVKNVKVKDSPKWLKDYLNSVGLRPINNIVDITNFVMMECGQPLHAFDYKLIDGKKIIVKKSNKLNYFTTLDLKERKLRDDILLICDNDKPIAIAGIMGGANTEINEETNTVFIESAYFNPVSVRKSSKFLSLQTDSSYRFERGVDIEIVDWACRRACQLIAQYGEGEIVNGFIDNYPSQKERRKIILRTEYLNKILGISFTKEHVKSILEKIEIPLIEEKDGMLYFEVPSFRNEDLKKEIDIVEEVARLNGYDNIKTSIEDNIYFEHKELSNSYFDFVNNIRDYLIGRGYKEIITNSLVSESYMKTFDDNYISLFNPSSLDMNVMRGNLYLGALEAIRYNFNFKANSLKLFEIGKVFSYSRIGDKYIKGIQERECLLIVLTGYYDFEAVNQQMRHFDIFDLKGELKILFDKLHIDNFKLNYYNYKTNFDNIIEYVKNDVVIAKIFDFSDDILNQYELNTSVICCEIELERLYNNAVDRRIYKEVSKYPPVIRDLSIVVDKGILLNEIENVIKSNSDDLLNSIRLYDIYNLGEEVHNKLSYTFTLEYLSYEKTLTDEEVNRIQDKIIRNLKKQLNAELRK